MENYLTLWYEEVEGLEGNLDKEEQEILNRINPQPDLLPRHWDMKSVFQLIEDNRPQLWRWLSLYPGQFDDLSGEELEILDKMPTRFLINNPLNFSARSIKMLVRAKIEEARKQKEEERKEAIRRSLELDKDKWDLYHQLRKKASSRTLAPMLFFSIFCSASFVAGSTQFAVFATAICIMVQILLFIQARQYTDKANAVRKTILTMPSSKDAPVGIRGAGVMALLLPVCTGVIIGAGVTGFALGLTHLAGWMVGVSAAVLVFILIKLLK